MKQLELDFNSINLYSFWKYSFNDKLDITSEITYINYLTQQAGGLTDQMFSNNILQSNRSRNWKERFYSPPFNYLSRTKRKYYQNYDYNYDS